MDASQLLVEVEHQLIREEKDIDILELETSFNNCDRGRTGLIGHKEVNHTIFSRISYTSLDHVFVFPKYLNI